MVFAAIDIGSNAVRLLFSNVFEDEKKTFFKKGSLIRVPIRLGEDSFLTGKISAEKTEALINSMKAFRELIGIYKPLDYLACATSAMRNASNSKEIVDRIESETGIKVYIIDGQKEAEIIYSNHIAEELDSKNAYLYIEVGGGSTELTMFSGNERIFSESFPVGTVRMINGAMNKNEWKKMRTYLKTKTKDVKSAKAIGTGGNISFLFKMMNMEEGKSVSSQKIKKMYDYISSFSMEERIKVLGIRPDRADVIIPALDIYLSVMKWTGINKIIIPQIGLADGIIHLLYEKYRYKKITGNIQQ